MFNSRVRFAFLIFAGVMFVDVRLLDKVNTHSALVFTWKTRASTPYVSVVGSGARTHGALEGLTQELPNIECVWIPENCG